ncbi:hypothetical protein lerEdw1_020733 [Lerista edwardsae]|nr:hypothetical protein lerEdw1_020733 [Lerista edwardsae]
MKGTARFWGQNVLGLRVMALLLFLMLLQLPHVCSKLMCRPWSKTQASADGIVIGAFASFIIKEMYEFPFNEHPRSLFKIYVMPKNYHQVLSFVYAMNEINQNADLLPNKTLKYKIQESAYNAMGTCAGTMALLFSEQRNPLNYLCNRKQKLMAIIGGLTAHNANQMPHILNIYKMPQVCIFSTGGITGKAGGTQTFLVLAVSFSSKVQRLGNSALCT